MEFRGRPCSFATPPREEETDLRRGPWTVDEDLVLMDYITANGEGRWNSLARCAGLRRTGKSCRLRWLNYLRPDVRRGNITPEEQLLILELHSRLGNRWSKIARHLPGRTDNEIKNYWRTRVQKHARQLRCDVNSKQFKDIMRHIWMPRLVERIREASSLQQQHEQHSQNIATALLSPAAPTLPSATFRQTTEAPPPNPSLDSSYSDTAQFSPPPASGTEVSGEWMQEEQLLMSPEACDYAGLPEFDQSAWGESLWSVDDFWVHQQL